MAKTKMTGIRKRGRSYTFSVSIGMDMDHKALRKYDTFVPPEDVSPERADILAQEAYMAFKLKIKGNQCINENIRFKELAEKFFKEYARSELKEITAYNYDATVRNHINPRFGNMKLKEITTPIVTEFLCNLKLKCRTRKKVKTVFQSIMAYAVKQKIISSNPCDNAIFKNSHEDNANDEVKYLTLKQAQYLLKHIGESTSPEPFPTIIKVLLHTGLRSGECLGLTWDCIDFQKRTITIKNTLSYANNRWYLCEPKSKSSRRILSMNDVVVKLLLEHKKRQDEQKAVVGAAWGQPQMVFTSCTGRWYDRSLLNTQFRRFIRNQERAGNLPYISVHGLRHTFASVLLATGESIENVSKVLGHSSVDITSRIYSHLLEETTTTISDKVSQMYGS